MTNTKPMYAAALLPHCVPGHISAALGAAVYVDDVLVEYLPESHSVQATEIGAQLGYALVDPDDFKFTKIIPTLARMNKGDGLFRDDRDPSNPSNGLRVTVNKLHRVAVPHTVYLTHLRARKAIKL